MSNIYDSWNALAAGSWKKSAEHNWFHTYVLYPAICSRIKTQSRILDYGCGSGELIEKVKKLGHKVLGFDPSIEMVKRAKQLNPGAFIVNDLNLLVNGNFDIVVLNLVLSCVRDAYSVVKSASSYTQRVIITVPHPCFSLFSDLHTTTQRIWLSKIVPGDEREFYFQEPVQNVIWDDEGTATPSFYRTLNTWFSIFQKCYLTVEHFEELVPIESGQCILGLYKKFSKIPPFILFDLHKKRQI